MKSHPLLFLGWLTLALAASVGCQSAKEPGSGSHASVKIPGRTLAEVQTTAIAVFAESGYTSTVTKPDQMVFDRPGSFLDAVKWGNLSGGGVNLRVKVRISGLADGSHRLQADAYVVQDSSDPFFQDENRNLLLSRGPYKKLLNEVARRLK